ncbi:uncharacterized protein [Periplaneta americana]|uniref:uncharacterized protein n=1 Tax=Periplaneta americana TaxID=6978 RepID=UPI0037E7C2AC
MHLTIILWLGTAQGTVDLNLPELEYVANHLKRIECKKLVASLHDPNFDIESNIDLAERKIPDDVSCLKLLVHWNSQAGEGKGETHLLLARRLDQLGHEKLAEWLSKTVFHQLGRDLNRTLLSDPFKKIIPTNDTEESTKETLTTIEGEEASDEWLPLDTILCAVIVSFLSIILYMLARVAWVRLFKKKRTKTKKQTKEKQNWNQSEWNQEKEALIKNTNISEHTDDETELSTTATSGTEDEAFYSITGIKKPIRES